MRICNLASGSKGNCTYIETKNHKILIDVGTTSIQIEKKLFEIEVNPSDIDIVLITHAHIDHVKGLKVFNKKYKPQIYITDLILKEANLLDMECNLIQDLDNIKDVKITAINLSHDVKDIKGYIIEEDNSSAVYITDTGYINEIYFEHIKNKNIYVFESNHDIEKLMNNPNYPHNTKIRILGDKGHLSNKDSAYYLSKIIGNETKYIVLAHISEQNNTKELALACLINTLKEKTVFTPKIFIAKQDEITEIIEV
jgi:phosphoribosyl 1,2-cyclic phosphodiesterase